MWSAVPEHGRLPSSGAQRVTLPLQTLPWPSSCSRVTCTRCCSWIHPSPMHPLRAGSARRRKPRGRPPRLCGQPTDPTVPAGPRAELPVSRVRRDAVRKREGLRTAFTTAPMGACCDSLPSLSLPQANRAPRIRPLPANLAVTAISPIAVLPRWRSLASS